MNRGRKIKQMRKFILKYGFISKEHSREPDKSFPPYRKGSYEAVFLDNYGITSQCVGDVDKYQVYKEIVKAIKQDIIPYINNEKD